MSELGLDAVAVNIAHREMIRILIMYTVMDDDPAQMRDNLGRFEKVTIDVLTRQRLLPDAGDELSATVKETASAYITKLIASIIP